GNENPSPSGSDSEPKHMAVDNSGAEKSHNMDGVNCEPPMDVDEAPSSMHAQVPIEMSMESLEQFCGEASRSFFDEIGLISHQINSYNEFISHGLQELFDSLGEVIVEPGNDPSKKGSAYATIKFGRVKLEKPAFWSGKDESEINFKPKQARLQNMTYAATMKVEVTIQVNYLEKSDGSKTGNDGFVPKKDYLNENHWIFIGCLPVMVNSNLCCLHGLKENDCFFDSGGYFLVKGMEKSALRVIVWIADRPCWTVSFLSEIKRQHIYVKLVESTKGEDISGSKIISISFLYATMPIWLLFFALGISSDKDAIDVIDMQNCDASVIETISMTIKESDEVCQGFRKSNKARQYVDELIKSSRFSPAESFDDYVARYLFPDMSGNRNKALFLGYMVKCLLLGYTGNLKCDDKSDFRNKRLALAGELLGRELRAHIRHAERRMVKAIQRDLDSDSNLKVLERYLDASIITNGLNRAFSTGSWCHPYKRNGRCRT
ncbi:hypothetical protein EJB05_49351, partial [Eragrostis curvula]